MKHVRDLYFHEDTQGYRCGQTDSFQHEAYNGNSHHPHRPSRDPLWFGFGSQKSNLFYPLGLIYIYIYIYGEGEIEAVSKLVVHVANDILILQFLVGIVTSHGLRFYFYLFVLFFISLICFLINSNVLIKFIFFISFM